LPTTRAVPCDDGTANLTVRVGQPWRAELRDANQVLLAAAEGQVRDVTVIGIGDSYSAGEGNPDVAAVLSKEPFGSLNQGPAVDAWMRDYGWVRRFWADKPAKWLDEECHRSVYSYQVMSMAQLAHANPKMLVRFAHWSCSGAEILDGLLFGQKGVKGESGKPQLQRAVAALCRRPPGQRSVPVGNLHLYRKTDPSVAPTSYAATTCEEGALKKPDLILLSVGGNDVSFAGVVVHLLAPQAGNAIWERIGLAVLDPVKPETAGQYIAKGWLRERYQLLEEVLRMQFGVSAATGAPKVLQLQYPSPLHRVGGGLCETKGSRGSDALAELFYANGARVWNMTMPKVEATVQRLIEPLQGAVLANQARPGWLVADRHLDDFKLRGFCSPDDETAQAAEYEFPRLRVTAYGSSWRGMTPAGWDAYARKSRWLRMPNDSFLTQIVECVGCLADPDRYRGTAHPNAYGQARFAQSVLGTVREKVIAGTD
jgi:hypothetical protein